jgi:hypothetical protein
LAFSVAALNEGNDFYAQTGSSGALILGRRLTSTWPDADGYELEGGQNVLGSLVVVHRDAAVMQDFVEEALDQIAALYTDVC